MARVNIVTGQAQTGKTTLALRLLRRTPRLLILDPVRSRPITQEVASGASRPFGTWTELSSFLASEESRGPWRVALRAQDEPDYIRALACAPFYRHVTLLVDEGLWFCSHLPLRRPLIKCARANAHFGGGIGVPLYITVQRPMDLPPDVRSQADQIISFRQEEPGDLSYLSERCSPSFAESVAALRNHRWVAFPPLSTNGGGHERKDDRGGSRGSGAIAGGVPVVPRPEPQHDRAVADDQSVGGDDGQ